MQSYRSFDIITLGARLHKSAPVNNQAIEMQEPTFVFTVDQGYDIVLWRAASQRTLASNLTVALL